MRLSLKRKYYLAVCAVVIGFMISLVALNMLLREPYIIWKNHLRMEKLAEEIAESFQKEINTLQEEISQLEFDNSVRISVVDQEGNLLATNQSQEKIAEAVSSAILKTLEENKQSITEHKSYFEKLAFRGEHSTSLLLIQKEEFGYVVIRKSVYGIRDSIQWMDGVYLTSGVLALLTCLGVVNLFSRRLVQPILEMNRITRKISNLQFDEHVTVKGKDELGELGASINMMSDHLRENVEEMQESIENRKILVRNMAHELKTPITVIGGYAEHLEYIAKNQPDKLARYCHVISSECSRMHHLINRMLRLSSFEKTEDFLQIQEFSAEEFLKRIKERYDVEFSDSFACYEGADETGKKIWGDPEILSEAVYNLVKNAVRYSEDHRRIRVKIWQEGKDAVFSVYNSGSRIDPLEQDKVWEPFYTVNQVRSRTQEGWGLGLSIVKAGVRAHGGNGKIINDKEGIEIRFTIPQP